MRTVFALLGWVVLAAPFASAIQASGDPGAGKPRKRSLHAEVVAFNFKPPDDFYDARIVRFYESGEWRSAEVWHDDAVTELVGRVSGESDGNALFGVATVLTTQQWKDLHAMVGRQVAEAPGRVIVYDGKATTQWRLRAEGSGRADSDVVWRPRRDRELNLFEICSPWTVALGMVRGTQTFEDLSDDTEVLADRPNEWRVFVYPEANTSVLYGQSHVGSDGWVRRSYTAILPVSVAEREQKDIAHLMKDALLECRIPDCDCFAVHCYPVNHERAVVVYAWTEGGKVAREEYLSVFYIVERTSRREQAHRALDESEGTAPPVLYGRRVEGSGKK